MEDLGSTIILYIIYIGLPILAYWDQKKKINYCLKKEKKKIIKKAFIYLAIMYLISITISCVSSILVQDYTETKPINQENIENLLQEGQLIKTMLVIFFSSFIAPIVEEVIFRWLIFKVVGENYVSMFISAILFGFAHYWQGDNIYLIFTKYILMGFLLTRIYKKNNYNILYPIAFHFVNNLIASLLFFLFTSQ